MKHLHIILLGCWLMYAAPALAQTPEPETVLGFTWSSRYKACLLKLKDRGLPLKTIKNESIMYTLDGVQTQLEFDEILGLNSIVVSKHFENDPKAAQLYLNDELRTINQTFGEYNTHQTHTGHFHRFEWKLKKTLISLHYYIPSGTVTAEYSKVLSF